MLASAAEIGFVNVNNDNFYMVTGQTITIHSG